MHIWRNFVWDDLLGKASDEEYSKVWAGVKPNQLSARTRTMRSKNSTLLGADLWNSSCL